MWPSVDTAGQSASTKCISLFFSSRKSSLERKRRLRARLESCNEISYLVCGAQPSTSTLLRHSWVTGLTEYEDKLKQHDSKPWTPSKRTPSNFSKMWMMSRCKEQSFWTHSWVSWRGWRREWRPRCNSAKSSKNATLCPRKQLYFLQLWRVDSVHLHWASRSSRNSLSAVHPHVSFDAGSPDVFLHHGPEIMGRVKACNVSAARSCVEGGLTQRSIPNEPFTFTIIVKDENGDTLTNGGHRLRTKFLKRPAAHTAEAPDVEVTDDKNGRYRLSFATSHVGQYSIEVCIDGTKMAQALIAICRTSVQCTEIWSSRVSEWHQIEWRSTNSYEYWTSEVLGFKICLGRTRCKPGRNELEAVRALWFRLYLPHRHCSKAISDRCG